MTRRFTNKALLCSTAENVLHDNIELFHGCGIEVKVLHDLCQLRCRDILDFHIAENWLNVVLVLPLVGVDSAFFQLMRCIVCKIPISKLREPHILIELRVTLAVSLELKSIFLSQFFGFLGCYSVRRSECCGFHHLFAVHICSDKNSDTECISTFCYVCQCKFLLNLHYGISLYLPL